MEIKMNKTIADTLESIKLEDFQDGLMAEEKWNLARDLTVIHNVLQTHDSTIFQIIASMNAMQKMFVEKLGIDEKELEALMRAELEIIQKEFIKRLNENNQQAES